MTGTLENLENLETSTDTISVPVAEPTMCPICGSTQISPLLTAPDRFHLRKVIYSLVSCSFCSGVWLSSPPKPAEMGLHYSEDYHKGIVAAGEGSAASRWKDQVKLISQHKRGGAILDIGCSSGGFLSTMKGKDWQLSGIEMEESTAERAHANTGADVFVGDAMDAPFLPGTFDVITTFDVLEHVYNPRQFLTKVLEWLKHGGIYYALMPNIDSWESKVFGSHWYGLELPRHLSHFSPKSIRYLMNEIGFWEVSVTTPAVSYVERSSGYVRSSLLQGVGLSATPQATPKPVSLPWKVVRKGIRLGIIRPLAHIASIAGAGPSMEVVFRKGSGK
jgi:SAM-dependent methyltransferase